MGRDLRAQRAQLRPRQPLLLLGQHRQLKLRREQARCLLDHPQDASPRPAHVPVERDQRSCALALNEQRRHHCGVQRALGVRGDQVWLHMHAIVSGALEQARQQISRPHLFSPLAVDREHGTGVRERDGGRPCQGPQVGDCLLGRVAAQSAAQVRQRGGGGMES
jgi:hypothetical protein